MPPSVRVPGCSPLGPAKRTDSPARSCPQGGMGRLRPFTGQKGLGARQRAGFATARRLASRGHLGQDGEERSGGPGPTSLPNTVPTGPVSDGGWLAGCGGRSRAMERLGARMRHRASTATPRAMRESPARARTRVFRRGEKARRRPCGPTSGAGGRRTEPGHAGPSRRGSRWRDGHDGGDMAARWMPNVIPEHATRARPKAMRTADRRRSGQGVAGASIMPARIAAALTGEGT